MMQPARAYISTLMLMAASVLYLGCEEMVDPANRTENAFTMYAVINPTQERQAMRVFPIEALLEATKPEPIDARVFSTDLNTDETVEWQDSLVQYEDGPYGHVFWSPFRAEYEHTYTLEVVRSDGVGASVTTTVPPYTEPQVAEPDSTDFDLVATVFWPDAPNLVNIEVEYVSNVGIYYANYGATSTAVEGGREIKIYFRRDTRIILQDARMARISPVLLQGVIIRAVVASADWAPPGGWFDADVLVEPGTLSNVERGFGFVASGYETATLWMPSDVIKRYVGFSAKK